MRYSKEHTFYNSFLTEQERLLLLLIPLNKDGRLKIIKMIYTEIYLNINEFYKITKGFADEKKLVYVNKFIVVAYNKSVEILDQLNRDDRDGYLPIIKVLEKAMKRLHAIILQMKGLDLLPKVQRVTCKYNLRNKV
jgi:hypothetical protein